MAITEPAQPISQTETVNECSQISDIHDNPEDWCERDIRSSGCLVSAGG